MAEFKDKVEFPGVECLKETDAALLCDINGKEIWIPKSQVDDDFEVYDAVDHNEGTLVISEWIATEKGLV